jgi:HEPN domain-containing protein
LDVKPRFDGPALVKDALESARHDFDLVFDVFGESEVEFLPIVVGYVLERLKPVVEEILGESRDLVSMNPSASLVWSAQALELLVKEGLCRPALLYRLSGDEEASQEIYRLLARNGGKPLASLLSPILGFKLDEVVDDSGDRVWHDLFGEDSGITASRNKVVHSGCKASKEEAEKAIQSVMSFFAWLRSYCLEEIEGAKRPWERR